MQSCISIVKASFSTSIKDGFPTIGAAEPIITICGSKFPGDYQCNSAMSIFKKHGKVLGYSSPKEVADKIYEYLHKDFFSETVVSPAGFISVKMSNNWLKENLNKMRTQEPHLGRKCPSDMLQISNEQIDSFLPTKVTVDFSSPNIAKEMHVGHLRSTILGESICRLLEYCGCEVDRVNHIGDWGTQFGMLIEYMKENNETKGDAAIDDLQAFYRASKQRFDECPEFKKRSQLNVVQLQDGDKESRKIWATICEVSRRSFQDVYDRLGVELVEKGESFYNDMIPGVVDLIEKQGKLEMYGDAKCVFTAKHRNGLMAVKSDGGYGYDSTDLAAIHYRLKTIESKWLIYVTDLGQEIHFHTLFDVAKDLGWHSPPSTRLTHVGFGLVQGADSKKFKTRSGDTVRLVDLLDEAGERSLKELKDRLGDEGTLSEEEMKTTANAIGVSAIKYFDLKQSRTSDYKFSFDKMLEPKGSSGVYLLYAYARICAIFRKANVDPSDIQCDLDLHEDERLLGVLILRYPDVIQSTLNEFQFNALAEYMEALTVAFSSFYKKCRVIGDEREKNRLVLCELTRRVLKACFYLMGITPLERI